MTTPLTAFGNNDEIESESNDIYNYPAIDTKIYGYIIAWISFIGLYSDFTSIILC
jgi:hypothetical protein